MKKAFLNLPKELNSYFFNRFILFLLCLIGIVIFGIKTKLLYETLFLFIPLIAFAILTSITLREVVKGNIYCYAGKCIKIADNGSWGIIDVDGLQIKVPFSKKTYSLGDELLVYFNPKRASQDGDVYIVNDVLSLSIKKYGNEDV